MKCVCTTFFYDKSALVTWKKKWAIKERENNKPGNIFKMEAVYLSLRLKGKRKSSKENWREMLNLGYAGHQNAVNVVFLGTKEISALGNRKLYLDFNLYINLI